LYFVWVLITTVTKKVVGVFAFSCAASIGTSSVVEAGVIVTTVEARHYH
jgi:hypothetical protein